MAQPESQQPLQRGSIAARKFWKFGCFCGNLNQNLRYFVTKFPRSFLLFFGRNFHKTYSVLVQKFHKNWCHFIGTFPKKFAFFKKFPKYLCKKNPQKFTFLENIHKDLIFWQTSRIILTFLFNFHNDFALLGELQPK